jgi:hypothetical protein
MNSNAMALPTPRAMAALALACCVTATAHAAVFDLRYDTGTEAKTLVTTITPDSHVSLAGLVTPGVVNNSLLFNWASTSDLSLNAAWRVGDAAATTPRLVGVNIDLFDAANTLVGSDSFGGLASGIARSSLQMNGLAPGSYRLSLTGTAVRDGIFDVDFSASATFPPPPDPPIVAADPTRFAYDTLIGSKVVAAPFATGDSLLLEGDSLELGALLNDTVVRLDTGTFSAGVRWVVDTAAGTGSRLIGVNLDLFDAANLLVASDAFEGVANGQASSSLVATGLAPGTYRLRMTGTSVRGARYRVALGTEAMPPVVPPIGVDVPAPATWTCALIGLSMVWLRRRPRAA